MRRKTVDLLNSKRKFKLIQTTNYTTRNCSSNQCQETFVDDFVRGICHIFFKLCNASFNLVIGPSLFSVKDSSSSKESKNKAFPSISWRKKRERKGYLINQIEKHVNNINLNQMKVISLCKYLCIGKVSNQNWQLRWQCSALESHLSS